MRIGEQTVSLPLSAKLTDADVKDVIAAVKKCLAIGSAGILKSTAAVDSANKFVAKV
jgi:hypothetical protein